MSELNVDSLRKQLRPHLQVVRSSDASRVPQLSPKQALKGIILPERGTRLLRTRPVNGEDRSARLFELGAILVEAGATPDQAFVLLQSSAWNKFQGRDDEVERLWEAVDRAIDKRDRDGSLAQTPHRGHGKVRAVRVDRLLARELPQSQWCVERIWEDRGWGFIAGEPKTYKSTFTTDLAISMATGTPFLGHFNVVKTGPVLVIQEENSENIQWARFNRILRHKDLAGKVHSFSEQSGTFEVTFPQSDCEVYCLDRSRFSFTNRKKRRALEADIQALQPRMVIFDPLQRMLGDLSIRNEQDVTKVLDWLDYLVQTYRTGLMCVHHYHKAREGGAMEGGQRMLGSQALHAWLTCGLYVSRQGGGRLKVSREFRAFADGGPFEIEFESQDDQDFYHVEVFEKDREGIRKTQDELLDLIMEQPGLNADEYAQALGITRRTARERLDRLVEKGLIEKASYKTKSAGRPKVGFRPAESQR